MAKRGRPKGVKGPAGSVDYRERKFIEGMLTGMCQRDAALYAGYAESTATHMAAEIYARPAVQNRLQSFYRRDEVAAHIVHEILRRALFETATTDITDAYDDDWNMLPKKDIPPAVRRQIKDCRKWDSPEQGSGSATKFESKIDAIAKHMKLVPLPPPLAESLDGAAESADAKLQELLDRIEEEEEEATDGPD